MEERLTVQERIDARRRRQEQESQFRQFQQWQQAQPEAEPQPWLQYQQPNPGQREPQQKCGSTYDYGETNYGKGATIFYIAGWLFQIF